MIDRNSDKFTASDSRLFVRKEIPVLQNIGPFKSGKEKRRERRKQERNRGKRYENN